MLSIFDRRQAIDGVLFSDGHMCPVDGVGSWAIGNEKRPASLQAVWNSMVAGDGIEPPTRGFSIPCSTN
jgi:hypothetical protein